MSSKHELTDFARHFVEPANSTHRLYEALRAYFVDDLPSAQAAQRFGYLPESFRVLVDRFRQDPQRAFFLTPAKGPQSSPKKDQARNLIITLGERCGQVRRVRPDEQVLRRPRILGRKARHGKIA
jgi:hypothetical protein